MSLYNVYDTKKECYIMEEVPMSELQAKFGINNKTISQYVCMGYKLERRYLIKHADGESDVSVPEYIQKAWDEIQKAKQILKDGGHIVTKYKNGKYIRYAEAKR